MSVRTEKPAQQARRRPAETVGSRAVAVASADHQVKVALAAYFIAEKRGFEPGHELEDWFAAEAQIAAAEQPSLIRPVQVSKAGSVS